MGWERKYWDIASQFFWAPSMLGLKKLKPETSVLAPEYYLIRKADVPKNNSIYTREIKAAEIEDHLRSKETVLNDFFDLTFHLAPDVLLNQLFARPLGFSSASSFESLGVEVWKRYGWSQGANITQQDGLYVSGDTVLCTELKLNHRASAGQIVKYACLMAFEEIYSGPKTNLGLLYIVPEGRLVSLWRECGLDGPRINSAILLDLKKKDLPKSLWQFLDINRDHIEDVLNRMGLAVLSWTNLRDMIASEEARLDRSKPAEQCLWKLLSGFRTALEAHRHTGI